MKTKKEIIGAYWRCIAGAKKGGSAKSEKKAAASRMNGKKPKKIGAAKATAARTKIQTSKTEGTK